MLNGEELLSPLTNDNDHLSEPSENGTPQTTRKKKSREERGSPGGEHRGRWHFASHPLRGEHNRFSGRLAAICCGPASSVIPRQSNCKAHSWLLASILTYPSSRQSISQVQAFATSQPAWAAPRFLVHLKWESSARI